ncbi:MAG TPA: class I SAM-dependent methyltransferase [Candidatus Angelobacter sp.]|nr:class I SAM-dependent methyltransferase [Candidatus Angelobacter sp.]
MKSLEKLQSTWEDFARIDPMWSICSDPEKRNRKWTREEFFATGRNEIKVVLEFAAGLGLKLDGNAPVLDFGCGVGRLTQALAPHFPECVGVDISPTMIALAKEFGQELPQCRFLLNEQDHLAGLQDGYFGFVYCSIVLQHMERKYSSRYIAEFLRALKPGGVLVFQLPDHWRASLWRKLRVRLALRARLQAVLGKDESHAMEMHCIQESAVRNLVQENGGRVVDVRLTNSTDPAFCGDLRYLAREPEYGYVSKQYCVVKR